MHKLYIIVHHICAYITTIIVAILIDFPLKIVISIFFTALFIICGILYPIIKKIDIKEEYYNKISKVLKYSTNKKCNIAIKIKHLWDVQK